MLYELLCTIRGHIFSAYLYYVLAVLLWLAWKWVTSYHQRLPPGPWGWPIIGHMKILGPNMYLDLTKLSDLHGQIISFYIGNRLTVVLNSYQSIREAFLTQGVNFAGRPYPWVMKLVNVKEEINNGTYSEEWKKERKFVLGALRQFGYTSGNLEEKITEEIASLLNTFQDYNGSEFDPREHLPKAMANLIFSIMINERYEFDDPSLAEKLHLIRQWQEAVGGANILDLFPLLRFIPWWPPLSRLHRARRQIYALYESHIDEHIAAFDPENCRDVIDVYLKERGLDFDKDKLIGLFFSFTGDAVDSLPETMVWLILYVTAYTDTQDRIREEISEITGSNSRLVTFGDRPRMTYTEAAIMECLRMSTFVPLTEPHHTLADCTLGGFHIPASSNVLGNLYAAHMDPAFWGDPQVFRPDRFLDQGRVVRPEAFMPYSEGHRRCLGEQLSNKVMFLFLAHLLQHYRLSFPVNRPAPSLEPVEWYNRKARRFDICASQITHS